MKDTQSSPRVWFTSDLHFSHENILKYCPWNRPWASAHEMNCALTKVWNETVGDNDTVYFLGDFAMKHNVVMSVLPILKGNIHLIAGNHDKWFEFSGKQHKANQIKSQVLNLSNVKEVTMHKMIVINGRAVLLHHFPWHTGKVDPNYVDRYSEYRPKKRDYPGVFLLYGHLHSKPEDRFKDRGIDVGWDAWGRLVSEEEIIKNLK